MTPLASVLIFPRRAARTLRLRPRWLGVFLLLASLSTGMMLLHHSARVAETLRHLPPELTGTDRTAVVADLDARLPARMLARPARLLAGWAAFSLLLYVVCRSVSPAIPLRFVQVLAMEVHCETVLILGEMIPLQYWANICMLWYVVLLTGGVCVLCAVRPLKAAFVVLLVWGSSLAFHAAVLRFLRDALHLVL